MKRLLTVALLLAGTAGWAVADTNPDFDRAIAYYLLNDMAQAGRYFEAYWRVNPQPTIRAGFSLLLNDDKWEATKKFKDYLDSDHRSLEALIGISLAISDIKNSNVIESLYRPLRLQPTFAPAFLCLGYEFLKRRDFPAAEKNFSDAVQNTDIPEYKIPLADLYLQTGQTQKAIDLLKAEADRFPENYYFNMLTARGLFQLGQLTQTARYLDQALVAKPDAQEAGLLKARCLLAEGDYRKAKSLLEGIRFQNYNPDYSLTFAEVLLRLKDRNASKYLYEVFSQNRWQPAVNRLMGLYHLQRNDKSVQNWIDRALVCGNRVDDLRKDFPDSFRFSLPPSFPAFDIRKIHWLDANTLLLAGRDQSGGGECLQVVDVSTFKVLKKLAYQGAIRDLFASPRGDRVVFSTSAIEDEKIYVYAFLWQPPKNIVLRPAIGYALSIPGMSAGFLPSGDMVYFTSDQLEEMAFDSPFSVMGGYGKQTSAYPRCPFPVFRYNFATDQFAEIKDRTNLQGIPIPALQKYFLVAEAFEQNSDIRKLIEKGQTLDITSSELVRIVFNPARTAFIIYFADLKNAFQALVYDRERNRALRVDATMFLGKNHFAECEVFYFDATRNEIFFLTRDKEKALYIFNYRTMLYRKVASGVIDAAYNENTRSLLLLTERTRYLYYTETNPEIVHLEPFARSRPSGRKDFEKIMAFDDAGRASFTTYNGEWIAVNEGEAETRIGISPTGAPFSESPDRTRVALFINGRLFVLPGII